MRYTVNVKKIIESNPAVDEKMFDEGSKSIRELSKSKVRRSYYDLIAPFGSRRTNLNTDLENQEDQRTVHIKR